MEEALVQPVEYRESLYNKIKRYIETQLYQYRVKKLDKLLDKLAGNDYWHARMEFKAAGYTPIEESEDDPNKWIQESVLQLLKVFSIQGHSGSSVPYALAYFERLAMHKPLTPLTGNKEEWQDGGGDLQNRRRGSVFKDKDTGKAYDIDGRVFWEWYTDEDGEKTKVYYTNRDSRLPIEFPYEVPEKPIYEYRESE